MENNVLKTGYRRLDDKYYGGIKRGELTMLYSRPGMGKSTLLSNVFLNMISQTPQIKCMIFTFEEPKTYVFEKMVCIKSRVSHWKYSNGEDCTEKDKQKVTIFVNTVRLCSVICVKHELFTDGRWGYFVRIGG